MRNTIKKIITHPKETPEDKEERGGKKFPSIHKSTDLRKGKRKGERRRQERIGERKIMNEPLETESETQTNPKEKVEEGEIEEEEEEEEDAIEGIRMEQQIFLRAALQLLLEKSQTTLFDHSYIPMANAAG